LASGSPETGFIFKHACTLCTTGCTGSVLSHVPFSDVIPVTHYQFFATGVTKGGVAFSIVNITGIGVVNIGEDVETVFSFLGTVEPSPSFKMLFDLDGSSMEKWKVLGLPTTFFINIDGEIVYRAVGGREFDHPEIQKAVMDLNK